MLLTCVWLITRDEIGGVNVKFLVLLFWGTPFLAGLDTMKESMLTGAAFTEIESTPNCSQLSKEKGESLTTENPVFDRESKIFPCSFSNFAASKEPDNAAL